MAKKYDESDGIWRTVGGRRIFIRNDQTLSEAMKESGKFTRGETESEAELARMKKYKKEDEERDTKAKKELTEEAKELMDDVRFLDPEAEGFDEAFAEIKERFSDLRRKESTWQSSQSKDVEETIKQLEEKTKSFKDTQGRTFTREELDKYMSISQEERVRAAEEGKDWKDLVKGKEDRLLAKASKIEKIEEEMEKVQRRIWNEENEMEAYGEENTSPAYDEDVHRLNDLRKELKQAKDEYWTEKKRINEKRFENELKEKDEVAKYEVEGMGKITEKQLKAEYDKHKDNVEMSYEDWKYDLLHDERSAIREIKLNEDEVTSYSQWKKDYGTNISELEKDLELSERYLDEDGEGYREAKKSLENGRKYLEDLKKADKTIKSDQAKYRNEFEEYKRKHPNTDLSLADYIKIKHAGVGASR